MRLYSPHRAAGRAPGRGGGPIGFAVATRLARLAATPARRRAPFARTGRTIAPPHGACRHGLATRCTLETGVTSVLTRGLARKSALRHRSRWRRHAETGTPWGRRRARCQRGWPDAGARGASGAMGVAGAAGAPGRALDAVPEMGLGPGWLRSQPAQPSTATIISTAAGRVRRLQVTGTSLRRRAGMGCAGRYAWSYCSRSSPGRRPVRPSGRRPVLPIGQPAQCAV